MKTIMYIIKKSNVDCGKIFIKRDRSDLKDKTIASILYISEKGAPLFELLKEVIGLYDETISDFDICYDLISKAGFTFEEVDSKLVSN